MPTTEPTAPRCCTPVRPVGDPDWQCDRPPLTGMPFCRSCAATGVPKVWRELVRQGEAVCTHVRLARPSERNGVLKLVVELLDDTTDPVVVWDAAFAELEWISATARAAGDDDVADEALRLWMERMIVQIG